eukprot:TRINITY_DN80560_c0_g1_i1.p1 TRINITY_DN80560_c0_g1~~TRINITY_DN80560_c0_g1_i1.p1  ORF type:complete len:464 (-),score=105.96 TRINITY_DN80560_c0_g1_i1:659-2050(-)
MTMSTLVLQRVRPRRSVLSRVQPLQRSWLALQQGRTASSGVVASSVVVEGEHDAKTAAQAAVDGLKKKLGNGPEPGLTIFFAKGYGSEAKPIGPLLQEQLAGSGVVIGASAEAGVIGDGKELQEAMFALSVLTIRTTGTSVFPFHTGSVLKGLPELGRGGDWEKLAESKAPPSLLAFASMPMYGDVSPQAWCSRLDEALCPEAEETSMSQLPTIIGGLTVGHHIFVDGEHHLGGAFGAALVPEESGVSFEALVCQGAVPFGPWLEITGVWKDHVITELDGKNPKAVLEPLLHGDHVPGSGHTMAGIIVDADLSDAVAENSRLATAALGGRPSCVIRPMHTFTEDGFLVLSPLTDMQGYREGMRMQLHCMNQELALEDLRMRAGCDVMQNSGLPPDAAVVVSCGARGVQLYEDEGVESDALQQAWGKSVPSTGFFAGGEIGPVGRQTYMHAFTTSCLLMRFPRH